MNDKLLKKIFPKKNCSSIKNLKYDNEGLWSISYPDLADSLTKHIKVFDNESFKLDTIIDATAGIGGNVLSFANFLIMYTVSRLTIKDLNIWKIILKIIIIVI